MKLNYIIKQTAGFLSLLLVLSFSACKKENTTKDLDAAPTADQVQFTVTPSPTNANVLTLVNQSPGFKALWDFGNGATGDGNTVTASYPLAGTYTVTLTIATAGGSVSSTKTVVIAATNPAMLTDPAFEILSGGLSNAAGFTWVIDQKSPGHLGVGEIGLMEPNWYQAGPDEKNGNGFYDDEMTFNMNGLKYTYDNKGTTFANAANAPGIGGPAGSDDPTVNYTPPTNLTWLVTENNGVKYITISGGGFISYYLGVSQYQILSLNENEMWLRCLDKANAGNAWYLKLIKKGYVRPVVQKPLQAANLSDDFQATANFTWTAENIDFVNSYDNPAKFPVNTSAKVGYYEKRTGDDGQYGNLNVTLPYRFNLATTNKIRLKVFFPSGNDFTKTAATVSVKLQNSLLGGNAWQTQTEIVKTISVAQYNTWVQLEFDFAGISDQTLYDKIVVQLGGEGHPNPGIFYLDDFEFK
ncbi:PKD domain-containing protein [Pedobacter chinensis]|uniref:PKD domain-containing protein n=1 Tax=Pedobacter chinensis TaxID=2282421 RepID=A0A369Q4F9_9SPHI|nr:PKD domain-containing protein [Pedobacter chinensis]RDC57208.1 PKD domain-containing protein [Pedobacter chinensis]